MLKRVLGFIVVTVVAGIAAFAWDVGTASWLLVTNRTDSDMTVTQVRIDGIPVEVIDNLAVPSGTAFSMDRNVSRGKHTLELSVNDGAGVYERSRTLSCDFEVPRPQSTCSMSVSAAKLTCNTCAGGVD